MKKKYRYLIIAVFAAFLFFGCGRKAPPFPPDVPELLPVKGISYTIDGGIVKIIWDKPKADNLAVVKSYAVHRSKTGIDEKNCEGCPVLFKRIAELNSDSTSYEELLEKGYKYIYKLVAISKYNTISPDSDFLRFTY